MKSLILTIFFTLTLVSQEIGVPYVIPKKSSTSNDFQALALNGNAFLFLEDVNIRLFDFKNPLNSQCLTPLDFQNHNPNTVELIGGKAVPYTHWSAFTATNNKMYLAFDEVIEVWDIPTWTQLASYETGVWNEKNHWNMLSILSVDEKHNKLFAGGFNYKHIYMYDLSTMKLLKRFNASDIACGYDLSKYSEDYRKKGHQCQINDISKIMDDRYFFTTAYSDQTLRKWDIDLGDEINSIKGKKFFSSILMNDSKTTVFSFVLDDNITLYSTNDLTPLHNIDTHGMRTISVVMDSKEQYIYGSFPQQKKIIRWDLASKTEKHQQLERSAGFLSLSKNNHYIIGSLEQEVMFWDLNDFQKVLTLFPINNCSWIAITPDGYFNASQDAIASVLIKDANGTQRPLNADEITKFYQPQEIQSILDKIRAQQ